MSGGDNWQVGDLALCIKVGPWTIDGCGPAPGSVSTVRDLDLFSPDGDLYLALEEWPDSRYTIERFRASRFRKITPPEADKFDREVIDLMLGKPVPVEA